MRIGIFGGTFNPPHKGHKKLALEIKEKAELDMIIIIPTFTPPHKEGKDLASGEHRIKMCEMMFTEDFFTVSDMEIKRQGKSFTYDTLLELKKFYGDDATPNYIVYLFKFRPLFAEFKPHYSQPT